MQTIDRAQFIAYINGQFLYKKEGILKAIDETLCTVALEAWLPACTLRVWLLSVGLAAYGRVAVVGCWLSFLIIFHPLSIEVQILYFMTELQQKGFVEFQVSEMDAKRNYALLLKIKNEKLDLATIENLVEEALTDTVEARLVGSPTNSPIGSKKV